MAWDFVVYGWTLVIFYSFCYLGRTLPVIDNDWLVMFENLIKYLRQWS